MNREGAPQGRRVGEPEAELQAARMDVEDLGNQLDEARKQQRRWAREARRLERSRSWRIGSFLIRAWRLLTFRRPASPRGPAELAASIESSGRHREQSISGGSQPAEVTDPKADTRPIKSMPVDLAPVLVQWGITRFSVKRKLGGSSGTTWLIETPSGMHVLRKVIDQSRSATGGSPTPALGTPREYLQYQVMVMRHLQSSNFPYQVPVVISPGGSLSDYVADGDNDWILYRFIEGERHSQPSAADQATDIGILAAHFDRVLATLDPGPLAGRFVLKLFDTPVTTGRLSAQARWISTRHDLVDLREVLLENIDDMLSAYTAISESEVEAVRKLDRSTVYNDWHPWNIVSRFGTIHGLIDFDAVVEAPRIVDFQNALTYVLASERFRPSHELVSAFAIGYCRVLSLSPLESALVYPVMLDRILWMIASLVDDVLEEGGQQKGGIAIREGLAIRLIRLGLWLRNHRDQVAADLRVG